MQWVSKKIGSISLLMCWLTSALRWPLYLPDNGINGAFRNGFLKYIFYFWINIPLSLFKIWHVFFQCFLFAAGMWPCYVIMYQENWRQDSTFIIQWFDGNLLSHVPRYGQFIFFASTSVKTLLCIGTIIFKYKCLGRVDCTEAED